MVKPIRPEEVTREIPDSVVEVFNTLIKEDWNGTEATVKQDRLVEMICDRTGVSRAQVLKTSSIIANL